MELSEFKELLLRSLKDDEISYRLSGLIRNGGDDAVATNEQKRQYQKQIEGLRLQNTKLEEENKYLGAKLEDVTNQLNQKIEDNKQYIVNEANNAKYLKELDEYRSMFGDLYKVIIMYNRLSEANKKSLKGLFKSNDPVVFLASGMSQGGIESLWEYAKMLIMKRDYGDIEELSGIIYFFIDVMNNVRNVPLNKLLDTKKGDVFDIEMHIRTSDSRPAGKIVRVLLQGFRNAGNNGIIKKSVVEVH